MYNWVFGWISIEHPKHKGVIKDESQNISIKETVKDEKKSQDLQFSQWLWCKCDKRKIHLWWT